MKLLGLFLVLLSALLSVANIFSGLELVDRILESSQWHLLRGLSLLFTGVLGQALLLTASGKKLEQQKLALLHNRELEKVFFLAQNARQMGIHFALASMLLSLVGLISGTMAIPGSFPLVHGFVGFSYPLISLTSLTLWIRYFSIK